MALIKVGIHEDLENIADLIRQGSLREARTRLLAVSPKHISPVDVVYYCSLLRRAGASVEAIKVLQPLVYPKARSARMATSEERLEYASCLVRLGILNEAERILQTIDAAKLPLVLIRLGFLFISRWDYERANEYFREYLAHPKRQSYDVLVAKVNLLQGLVNLRNTGEAEILAQELEAVLDLSQNRLLLAAVYEFVSELRRLEMDLDGALRFVRQGRNLLVDDTSIDEFLLRKQEGIIKAYRNKTVVGLRRLRAEAVERKYFEGVRDLDLHAAVVRKDAHLLGEVFWKTQSTAYKEKVRLLAAENDIPLQTSFYKFKKNQGLLFSLTTGLFRPDESQIKKDKALAKLLTALLVEGYRPLRIFDLFAAVYGNEIFFPTSSADKMHQLFKRLRQFFDEAKLPLSLECRRGLYTLAVHGNFTLVTNEDFDVHWASALRQRFGKKYFTAVQAQEFWGCSRRTAFRRLDELKASGKVGVTGQTRAARYRFVCSVRNT
jgi:hypothetical protein